MRRSPLIGLLPHDIPRRRRMTCTPTAEQLAFELSDQGCGPAPKWCKATPPMAAEPFFEWVGGWSCAQR
eukprot:385059-Amphidinium_carterae.1